MEKFIRKIQLHNIEKYQTPCLITMTGKSGSRKTLLAQQLSRELKIFLLSNDYIRTYFFEEQKMTRSQIEKEVLRINTERLLKLIISHNSFVLDRDFNQKKELVLSNKFAKICGYIPIHIKINSYDIANIKRIQNRKLNHSQRDLTIIGDNTSYSSPFSEADYKKINISKPRMEQDFSFDYVLDNYGPEEKFIEESTNIIHSIKKKLIK